MKPLTLDTALGKPSRDLLKIKEKLKQQQQKAAKQYNSLCYDIDDHFEANIITQQRERKHSKRDYKKHNSPARLIRSKSKYIEKNSGKKEKQVKRHDIGALYSELMAVKSQYKKLKGSYEQLEIEKQILTSRGQKAIQTQNTFEKVAKQIEKQKKKNQLLQQQLQRIKKQSLRLVQTEKFKNKRLEEIIQQKDLMIAFLRNQNQKLKKSCDSAWCTTNQSSVVYFQNLSQLNYMPSSINCSNISNIVLDEHKPFKQQDSLCFSKDHSKFMDSINSDQCVAKKDIVIVETIPVDPFKEPSQCLTFQQREEEPEQKEHLRLPPRQNKKDSARSKNIKSTKKLKLATHGDENIDNNSKKGDSQDHKLLSSISFSKQKKKISSSRKKI